jgi:hypothetical protein
MLKNNLAYLDEVHTCPHCQERMSCCEAPPVHVGDGLGWGSEVLFICLNDECSLFLNGWDQIDRQYGHHASYRYMELPGSKESNVMMVGNADAFKGSVIDPVVLKSQNSRYQQEKLAVKALDTALAERNLVPVMTLVLDEAAEKPYRLKALEIMGQLGDLSVIDQVRNHVFRDTSVEQEANFVIARILKDNFKKECPYCLEVIKAQAKKCKHCQTAI